MGFKRGARRPNSMGIRGSRASRSCSVLSVGARRSLKPPGASLDAGPFFAGAHQRPRGHLRFVPPLQEAAVENPLVACCRLVFVAAALAAARYAPPVADAGFAIEEEECHPHPLSGSAAHASRPWWCPPSRPARPFCRPWCRRRLRPFRHAAVSGFGCRRRRVCFR